MPSYVKKIIAAIFLFVFIIGLVVYQDQLIRVSQQLILAHDQNSFNEPNEYQITYEFKYIRNTNNFEPKNHQDLLNIYYTFINSGSTSFSFFCPREYRNCIEDVGEISRNAELLSHLNNFVHPFNSFEYITTSFNNMNKVTVELKHNYTTEMINKINVEVARLEQQLIRDDMTNEQKIRVIHDYIIENSKYDVGRANKTDFSHQSNLAYGPLFEGFAICSGYSDAMAIFLNRWNIPNFRAASANHIWNVVYINNEWLHLDLTWNNPVLPDGSQIIDHTFFLITTARLKEIDTDEHNFPTDIYIEAS